MSKLTQNRIVSYSQFHLISQGAVMDSINSLIQNDAVIDLADQDDLGYFVTGGTILHW